MITSDTPRILFLNGEEISAFELSGNDKKDLDAARALLRKAVDRRVRCKDISTGRPDRENQPAAVQELSRPAAR